MKDTEQEFDNYLRSHQYKEIFDLIQKTDPSIKFFCGFSNGEWDSIQYLRYEDIDGIIKTLDLPDLLQTPQGERLLLQKELNVYNYREITKLTKRVSKIKVISKNKKHLTKINEFKSKFDDWFLKHGLYEVLESDDHNNTEKSEQYEDERRKRLHILGIKLDPGIKKTEAEKEAIINEYYDSGIEKLRKEVAEREEKHRSQEEIEEKGKDEFYFTNRDEFLNLKISWKDPETGKEIEQTTIEAIADRIKKRINEIDLSKEYEVNSFIKKVYRKEIRELKRVISIHKKDIEIETNPYSDTHYWQSIDKAFGYQDLTRQVLISFHLLKVYEQCLKEKGLDEFIENIDNDIPKGIHDKYSKLFPGKKQKDETVKDVDLETKKGGQLKELTGYGFNKDYSIFTFDNGKIVLGIPVYFQKAYKFCAKEFKDVETFTGTLAKQKLKEFDNQYDNYDSFSGLFRNNKRCRKIFDNVFIHHKNSQDYRINKEVIPD